MNIELQALNLTTDVRLILSGLCRISTKRPIKYSLTDSESESSESDSVLIINGEDEHSVRRWEELKTSDPQLTAVVINNDDLHDNVTTYSVARESLGMKFLHLLDAIVNTRKEAIAKLAPAPEAKDDKAQNAFTTPEKVDQKVAEISVAKKIAKAAAATQKRALIVDDSASVRRQLSEFLKRRNLNVEEASSASEALQKADERTYDIIFLDIVMPEMDGYKACKKIKKSKHCGETPVVMLTSKSSTFNKARGILAGCDAYLTKPVKVPLLKQVLLEQL